jgi:GcrA cell cycle regulator
MTYGMASSWTPERIERLLALAEEGLSAEGIAERLGGVSRNAVVGKLHRLGKKLGLLNGNPKVPRSKYMAPRKAKPRAPRPRITKPRIVHNSPPPLQVTVPTGAGVPFLEIERHQCRWPLWGDDHPPTEDKRYCGSPTAEESSYCAWHHRQSIGQREGRHFILQPIGRAA